jgi:pimeloyl-ACP methyl ester carboxylesterase
MRQRGVHFGLGSTRHDVLLQETDNGAFGPMGDAHIGATVIGTVGSDERHIALPDGTSFLNSALPRQRPDDVSDNICLSLRYFIRLVSCLNEVTVSSLADMRTCVLRIANLKIECSEYGDGPPTLYFHNLTGLRLEQPFLARLAEGRRVVAPALPGFDGSELADWIGTVDDLSYVMLELVDSLKIDRFALVGSGIGGWLATELACKTPERVQSLALISPFGVKTGPSDRLDIPDIFAMSQAELSTRLSVTCDVNDVSELTDNDVASLVRNRETTTLLAWEPYFHNPQLKHRMHRIKAPALLLRGKDDGLVSAAYLENYRHLLPRAKSAEVVHAGHLAQVDQHEATAQLVNDFLAGAEW